MFSAPVQGEYDSKNSDTDTIPAHILNPTFKFHDDSIDCVMCDNVLTMTFHWLHTGCTSLNKTATFI